MLAQYIGLITLAAAALTICLAVKGVSRWLRGVGGEARQEPLRPATQAEPSPPPGVRPNPKLIPLALLFLVLQAAALTLLLWSSVSRGLGSPGWSAMACFAATGVSAWVYVRSRGAFEW